MQSAIVKVTDKLISAPDGSADPSGINNGFDFARILIHPDPDPSDPPDSADPS